MNWTDNGEALTLEAGEAFQITPRLRWAIPEAVKKYTTPQFPVLQQMWQGNRGTQRWENVPLVVDESLKP